MPSDLLKCTLCPGKDKFSDVSHLLTHVGSKGHLAHLHRLQVRSHQEISAAHKLAVYNQWFQEHGVAALLSDRMLQKDQKQADKQAANRKRMAAATPAKGRSRGRKLAKVSEAPPQAATYETRSSGVDCQRNASMFHDPHDTPYHGPRQSSYPDLNSSPPKLPSRSAPQGDDINPISENGSQQKSPSSPQLKGTQWPGMALFDAAPEDLRRKRNQRKDISVLENLERNAALVQPTEVVSSATGIVLKQRHMDDLENDSPVEGEVEVVQPTPKSRKSTGPRAKRPPRKGKNKPQGQAKPAKRARRSRRALETPSKLLSSSSGNMVRSSSRFSPTEEENKEFKHTVRNLGRKRRRNNFSVYQESSPAFGVDGSSEVAGSHYVEASTARLQPSYSVAPWARQQQISFEPFKTVRERMMSYPAFGELGNGKENVVQTINNHSANPQEMVNPLFFQADDERYAGRRPMQMQNRFGSVVPSLPEADPFNDAGNFLPVRNPLMLAFEQLRSPVRTNGYGFDAHENTGYAPQHRQPLFAP